MHFIEFLANYASNGLILELTPHENPILNFIETNCS